MADVNDYSTTPASNTTDFPENQAPSTVNDGARETQADIAKWRERLEGEATVGGTVDAITLVFSSPHAALVDNRLMTFEAAGANATTTPTLKEDSLVAKTIVKNGNQALSVGDIFGAGHRCIVQYDSGNDVYELLNPAGQEEGTWIPTIQDTSESDAEGQTYSVQEGNYIKIGNYVFVSGQVAISSLGTLTGANQARIGGLPYTSNATGRGSIHFATASSLNLSTAASISGQVLESDNVIYLYEWNTVSGVGSLSISELSVDASLVFSGQYKV